MGYEPAQQIEFFAWCNGKADHRILGHMALYLADHYGGMIDLNGALTPPLTDGMADDRSVTLKATSAFVRQFPGRVLERSFGNEAEWPWVSHMVDAEFMRAWLLHPDFHLIK